VRSPELLPEDGCGHGDGDEVRDKAHARGFPACHKSLVTTQGSFLSAPVSPNGLVTRALVLPAKSPSQSHQERQMDVESQELKSVLNITKANHFNRKHFYFISMLSNDYQQ
jgi:hypothetical protein